MAGIASAGERARCQHGDPVAVAAFEHRFGQLLDEQRNAVGALDDLVDGLAGETGIAGEPLDQCRAIAPAEPVQRQRWSHAAGRSRRAGTRGGR